MSAMSQSLVWIAAAQAVYFGVTGIWPLVDIHSFMRVTGPKRDIWLVRTVGVLVTVIAAAIALAGWRREIDVPVIALAIGSAAALGAVDVIYVLRGTIAKIYLADAAAEALLIAAWTIALVAGR
jgi:hypothetical protein